MEYMGEEYFKLKATVIKYERFLLKELGFCVHVKHPHKLIITYLQMLEMEKNEQLAQRSWNCMNDSLRTNVFVRFTPETIACACIFLAARELKIPLPQSPPWWLLFDADYEDIEAICLELLSLYRQPKIQLEKLEKRVGLLKEELQKKQIEIKEVKLKKAETELPSSKKGLLPTPGPVSNKQGSPLPPNAKSDTQSSPVPSPKPTRSLPKSYKMDDHTSSSPPRLSRPVPRSYKNLSPQPPSLPLFSTTATALKKPAATTWGASNNNPSSSSSLSRNSSPPPLLFPSSSQTYSNLPEEPGSFSSIISRKRKVVPSPIRWKDSPDNMGGDSESESHTPSPLHKGHTPRAYKPVVVPIILGEEDSEEDDKVPSPLLSQQRRENGIQQERSHHYSSHDRKVRKSRHKHREPAERKMHRVRSREREREDHRRKLKLHHRARGKEREKERERDRTWRERDDYVYEKRDREVYDKRERERDYGYEHSRKSDPYRR